MFSGRNWQHTATVWHAIETGFETYVLRNCSFQPGELVQFSSYGVDKPGAISSAVKAYIPKQGEPIAITPGADYIAFGDYGLDERPTATALQVIGVNDYTMFPLPHYEVRAL